MNENVLKLLDLMSKDEDLQKKFAAIHDVDEAYALAVSVLGGYTKEEFIATVTALQEQMATDLNEKDLSAAAGGQDLSKGELSAAITTSCTVACTMAVLVFA